MSTGNVSTAINILRPDWWMRTHQQWLIRAATEAEQIIISVMSGRRMPTRELSDANRKIIHVSSDELSGTENIIGRDEKKTGSIGVANGSITTISRSICLTWSSPSPTVSSLPYNSTWRVYRPPSTTIATLPRSCGFWNANCNLYPHPPTRIALSLSYRISLSPPKY